MTGLRRRAPLIGTLVAWLFAFATLAGGLALARALPEAHAAALTHASLCLTGENPELPPGHAPGHGAGCLACPAPTAPALAALDAPASSIAAHAPRRAPTIVTFAAVAGEERGAVPARDGDARAPPRA